jgi:hypothetical protein
MSRPRSTLPGSVTKCPGETVEDRRTILEYAITTRCRR